MPAWTPFFQPRLGWPCSCPPSHLEEPFIGGELPEKAPLTPDEDELFILSRVRILVRSTPARSANSCSVTLSSASRQEVEPSHLLL